MPFLIPVALAFGVGALGAGAIGASIFGIGGLAGALLIGGIDAAITLGSELLTMALTPTPKPPGQQLSVSLDPYQPRTVIAGRSGTAGSLATFQTWGDNNENIILVFAVADHKCDSLAGGWWMGEPMQINADGSVQQGYYKNTPYLWVRFYPGDWNDQIDPTLLANSGGRWAPGAWGRGVAKVVVQAKFNENAHPQGLSGLFQFIWDIKGAHLYDRRLDSSVGGSGPARWDDQSTWGYSANGPVAVENFLRGFRVEDTSAPVGSRASDTFYGLNLTDADLPFAANVAGFNTADETVAELNAGAELSAAANNDTSSIVLTSAAGLAAGMTITIGLNLQNVELVQVSAINGLTVQLASKLVYNHADGEEVYWVASGGGGLTVARYAIGGNLPCNVDGQTALGNMLAACGDGRLLTGSGVDYVILPGVAHTPLARPDGTAGATVQDTDLRLDGPHKFQQYQQLDQIVNAIYGRWSDPTKYYTAVALPPRLSPADETEDGGRKDVTFDVTYCTNSSQGQRCQEIYRRRARSQMTAQICLGPQYMCVEGGDWIEWQSDRYGFIAVFEVQNARWVLDDDKNFLGVVLDLQEIESSVFDWDPDVDELSLTAPQTLPSADPNAAEIAGFAVSVGSLTDPTSGASIPALTFSWTNVSDIYAVSVQLEWRVQGQPATASSTFTTTVSVDPTTAIAGGVTTQTVTEGVNSGLLYEARAIEITVPIRPAEYTPWTAAPAITPGTVVSVAATVPWPGVGDPDDTRPANNATVGAQSGVNLSSSSGAPLGDPDVITALGTSANTSNVGKQTASQINSALGALAPLQDTSTPNTPPAPGVAFTTALDANGNLIVTMTGTVAAATDANIAGYEFELALNGAAVGTPYTVAAPATSFIWQVPPGVSYSLQVREVKLSGVRGSFSTAATGTTALNTSPPAAPTMSSFTATPGYQSNLLSWTNPSNVDLDHIEVWAATSNSLSSATQVGSVQAAAGLTSSYTHAGLATAATWYYWIRAVNGSGLKSGFTGSTSSTTAGIPASALNTPIAASQITSIAATQVTGTLTATQIASVNASTINGILAAANIPSLSTLSGQVSSSQIASVAAGIITGTLAASNIPGIDASKIVSGTLPAAVSVPVSTLSGQITSSQIGSVAASKMTGVLATSNIPGIDASKVITGQFGSAFLATGAVGTTQIAAGAVISSSIAAGTIVAANIAGGTITGSLIAANTIVAANIAACTITAAQLALGTFSNNLVPNGGFIGPGLIAWTDLAGKGASTNPSAGPTNGPCAVIAAGGDVVASNAFQVVPSATYLLTWQDATPGTLSSGYYFRLAWSASAPATYVGLTSSPQNYTDLIANSAVGGWTNRSSVWTAPSGANFLSIYIYNNSTGSAPLLVANVSAQQQLASGNIAAGAITAINIAAATITSTQIAAGTIVASNIAAGTITGGLIAANTIVAANIVAGTLTTACFTSNSISGAIISAGTLNATAIVAGSLTATQIAAGTITGALIAANTITAGLIQAGTLTAAQFAVGTFSNNVVANGSYAQGLAGWYDLQRSSYVNPTVGPTGGPAVVIAQSNGSGIFSSAFPIIGGQTYLLTVQYAATASQSAGFYWRICYQAGSSTTFVPATNCYDIIGSGSVGGWTSASYVWTAPSNQNFASVAFYNTNTFGSGVVLVANVTCQQQLVGGNIAAGTITAANIQANSITGACIAAQTITSVQIAGGTIVGQNIAGNTITGSNIAAGTITATNISAGTITATQISASAGITASMISVSSLSALSATFGSMQASTLTIVAGSSSAPFFAVSGNAAYIAAAFINSLSVGTLITVGAGSGIKVALQAFQVSVTDGQSVTFPTNLGSIPLISFDPTGLNALGTMQTYQCTAVSLTPSGCTVSLKKLMAGTTTSRSCSGSSAASGGPTLQVSNSYGNAYNSTYVFSGTGPGGGNSANPDANAVTTWFQIGGTWYQGNDIVYSSSSTSTKSWGGSVKYSGSGTVTAFGVSYDASDSDNTNGTGLTFGGVTFSTQSGSTTTTASPNGETCVMTVQPTNGG